MDFVSGFQKIFGAKRWLELYDARGEVIAGFIMTVKVSFFALIIALIIGVVVGLCMASTRRWLDRICRAYIAFFQNTPLVIQVILIYLVIMPAMGVYRKKVEAGIIGLSIYTGAYCATIVHSAIVSVPAGQFEAANSQGFGFLGAMAHVILPQAVRIALPPLTNQAVNLIKNSSVLAVITARDLIYSLDSIAARSDNYGPPLLMTGLLYLCICLPISLLARRLEGRLVRHG